MIRYMDVDVSSATEDQLIAWARLIRIERMRRGGRVITCQRCHTRVVARRDARYCSARCRVAAHREAKADG